jgi:hypothetical protein
MPLFFLCANSFSILLFENCTLKKMHAHSRNLFISDARIMQNLLANAEEIKNQAVILTSGQDAGQQAEAKSTKMCNLFPVYVKIGTYRIRR